MSNLPVAMPPPKNLPSRRQPKDELTQIIGAFESATVDVLVRTSPVSDRISLYVVLTFLATLIGLASVVKLDRAVTGSATVLASAGQLYVSPLNSGVVREVLVKVGDVVKKGQVLATLDPTLSQADVTQVQQQLASDEALLKRLMAEHENRSYPLDASNPYSEVQHAIWQQRQAELRATLANLDAQISSNEAVTTRYREDAAQYSKRMQLASDVENMYEPLIKKGYVSRQQYLSSRDSKEEMSRLYSQAQNQIAAQEQSTAAIRAQRAAAVQKWRADAGAQMVTTRDRVNTAREQLQKAQRMLELDTLTAPADGIVLRIGKVSAGSIASMMQLSDPDNAGALFTLAPLDAPLALEMRVPARDIGFIRTGDPVMIKLDAYDFIRHGTADGRITTISEGSFTTDENGRPVPPYFKARVAITKADLRDVPKDFRIAPGTTATADVLIGKRTIIRYVLDGALRTSATAMREVQ